VILMPIVYVREMDASLAFYESLGFEVESRSPMWSRLNAGDGAALALHGEVDGNAGHIELAMNADDLDVLAGRNDVARGIADEAFGRSLVLRDPNGLAIQVNSHDPTL
jgi:catechol 2,3-dioxygenase-like lactoylglutathione lyase family enzyme